MISEKMQGAINNQINAEMYSSYLYLSMSAWFEHAGLEGFANWMRVQAQEEMVHAMKMYTFINERGGKVTLQAIDAPPTEWSAPLEIFKAVCDHEAKVTGLINGLMKVAREENDNASIIFLEWFVTEQVEEEKSAGDWVKNLQLIGENGHGLFMLNREALARVFTPPATPVA